MDQNVIIIFFLVNLACLYTSLAGEKVKCLTSPDYPINYPDNSNTNQKLSVPARQDIEVTFHDFNVESHHFMTSMLNPIIPSCSYDYVEFFDGIGNVIGKKLCGDSLPQKFTILSSTASVLFHSDRNGRMKGFKFCYKAVEKVRCLTSPGYPINYPDKSNTNQKLSVPARQDIEISFNDFNVESHPHSSCGYDYVEFFDGNGNVIGKKLCGDSLPQKFTIPTSTASVLFHSDGSIRMKGFKFCYKAVSCVGSWEYGVEYTGSDLRSCSENKKKSAKECQHFCQTIPGCVGWEWGHDGDNCCAKSAMTINRRIDMTNLQYLLRLSDRKKTLKLIGRVAGKVNSCRGCNGENDGCCTSENKCGLDEGDCDSDDDCKEGLKCGANNCNAVLKNGMWDYGDDCCYDPRINKKLFNCDKMWEASVKCGPDFGDCDKSWECFDGFICGNANCNWKNAWHTTDDDCCRTIL